MSLGPVERASIEGRAEACFEKCHCAGPDYLWDPTCLACREAGCGGDLPEVPRRLLALRPDGTVGPAT